MNIKMEILEGLTVRDMQTSDIPDVLALQERIIGAEDFDARWFYPFSEEELDQLTEGTEGMAIGVWAEGRIIAFRAGSFSGSEYEEITDTLGSPYTEFPCFLMNGAFVDPAFRGKHLQQVMTELCIDRCRKLGIHTFLAVVHPDNISSIKSLKNIGFSERTRKLIFGGTYDRLILVKEKLG